MNISRPPGLMRLAFCIARSHALTALSNTPPLFAATELSDQLLLNMIRDFDLSPVWILVDRTVIAQDLIDLLIGHLVALRHILKQPM